MILHHGSKWFTFLAQCLYISIINMKWIYGEGVEFMAVWDIVNVIKFSWLWYISYTSYQKLLYDKRYTRDTDQKRWEEYEPNACLDEHLWGHGQVELKGLFPSYVTLCHHDNLVIPRVKLLLKLCFANSWNFILR